MSDYISKDALLAEFENAGWYDLADRDDVAEDLLLCAPTVDVVPVVRCEKCRFKDRPSCPGFDALQGMTNLSLGFCSNGARKDDNHA